MSGRTRVWLLRHAESADNAAGVLSSRLPGADLTAVGRAQAAAAAALLAGEPVAAVHASPALRARRTAGVVAGRLGVPVTVDAGLVEADLGVWEGRAAAADGAAGASCLGVLAAWVRDHDLAARMPGGEDGYEVATRFAAAMDRLVAAHPGGTVAVVSHVVTISVGLIGLGADLGDDPVWGRPLAHAAPLLATVEDQRWHAPWNVA